MPAKDVLIEDAEASNSEGSGYNQASKDKEEIDLELSSCGGCGWVGQDDFPVNSEASNEGE